jgi:hypothetical protein
MQDKGENNMKCPYCSEDMIQGYIYGDRYALKWSSQKLILGTWVQNGIKLGNSGDIISRPCVEAYSCEFCKKMIISY